MGIPMGMGTAGIQWGFPTWVFACVCGGRENLK